MNEIQARHQLNHSPRTFNLEEVKFAKFLSSQLTAFSRGCRGIQVLRDRMSSKWSRRLSARQANYHVQHQSKWVCRSLLFPFHTIYYFTRLGWIVSWPKRNSFRLWRPTLCKLLSYMFWISLIECWQRNRSCTRVCPGFKPNDMRLYSWLPLIHSWLAFVRRVCQRLPWNPNQASSFAWLPGWFLLPLPWSH